MKAVIYARFSSDRQREESIEGQLRECHEYAQKNGITIVHEYVDRALSASKDTEKRLDFLKMIRDSAKGQFEAVLVWKLDRFARDRYDSAQYKHILKQNGVRVISATEPISEGPEGIILEAMLEGIAEYYSAELSVKIHRGQKENALKCRNNGGVIPLGYKLGADQVLEVDPVTAPIVQEIFKRYADGETIKEIQTDLNKRGLKTSYGQPFHYSAFSTILKNRKYIGEYKYQDVVIPNGIPAIVEQDIFDRAQMRRERNRRAPAAAKAEDAYLLTTKLFCGKCGKMMVGESGKGRAGRIYRYYKCHSAKNKTGCDKKPVKKEWIEDIVVNQTMQLVFDDTVMQRLTDRLVELQGKESYDARVLNKQLSEVSKSLNNVMKAIEAGIITETTKQRLEELEAQRAEIENNIAVERIKSPVLSREQIEFFLAQFRKTDVNDEQARQRLIDCFVNAVYVYDDRIVFAFNYKDGTATVSLDDIDGSDLQGETPPKPLQSLRLQGLSLLCTHSLPAEKPRIVQGLPRKVAIPCYLTLFGGIMHKNGISVHIGGMNDETYADGKAHAAGAAAAVCADAAVGVRRALAEGAGGGRGRGGWHSQLCGVGKGPLDQCS